MVGLLISVSIALMAFEYRTYDYMVTDFVPIEDEVYDIEEITKIIRIKKPEPKQKKEIKKKIKKTSSVVKEVKKIDTLLVDIPLPEPKDTFELFFPEPTEPEPVEDLVIFTPVEKMPEFCNGGEAGLFEYLGQNIKYPQMAIESGITGTVYVSFTVRKSGKITDIKTLRGIGGGCDKEAIRVIKGMCWEPGMQREKPVSVNFTLPIKFVLQ
jgi:protein TonB